MPGITHAKDPRWQESAQIEGNFSLILFDEVPCGCNQGSVAF